MFATLLPAAVALTDTATDSVDISTDAAGGAAAAAVLGGFGIFMLLFILIAVVLGVFTIWMFIDALMRKDEDYEKIGSGGKVVWALLIFFIGFIPAILYWFMIRKKAKAAEAPAAK